MAVDKSIGLALGGGGARGIAHIVVLEVFDDLGLKPAAISGTSIGAIMGAAYASGMSGKEIRERAVEFYSQRRAVLAKLWRARPVQFTDLIRGRFLQTQFDPEIVLESFVPGIETLPDTFEGLKIPLKVVACDFYGWCETVIDTGPLRPAIAASIAIPSVFKPVPVHGRMQIDGGAFNPLPFDHVSDHDLVVASDVAGGPIGEPDHYPSLLEVVVGAAQISMQAIMAEKMKWHQPDILVQPDTNGVFVLDFFKTKQILENNEAIKDDFKRRLELAIEAEELFDREPAERARITRHRHPIENGVQQRTL
ncbi:MAG TPA: patatin-like phospholipase family protein [Afifellaceae bacterium]|nr:patatin-like phospholipase family protein [Afifellaceae bacterium]